MSTSVLADCGDITKRLLNIEVGGSRSYLGNLPSSVKMSFQHNFGDNGMDMMYGAVMALDVNSAAAYWYNDRVYMVLATIYGKDAGDIERALRTVLSIADTDFDPNPRLVPQGEYLRCKDGLTAKVVKGQIFQSRTIPILVVGIEHSKMKLRFECAQKPQQCRNLPKGYLD
ncbi:MAG TPA: hypothetical protein VIV54_24570 [Burkholderiales bacterium]